MKAEFITNLNRQYLSVSGNDASAVETGYAARMILENRIDGLLPASRAGIDGRELLCYDITGRISVSSFLSARTADAAFYAGLLRSLSGIWETLPRYLIRQEAVMVLPEQIFFDPDGKRFCYGIWPSENKDYGRHLQKLAEYLLTGLPSGDQRAAQMVYQFYQACISGGVTAAELRKITGNPFAQNVREEIRVPSEELRMGLSGELSGEKPLRNPAKSRKKKETDRPGKQEKDPSRPGIFAKVFRKITRDHAEIRAEKQKKKDEENEAFFRSIIEKDSRNHVGTAHDPQGTVLLSEAVSRSPQGGFTLVSKKPDQEDIPIVEDDNVIGRQKDQCDLLIPDITVSRFHARLIRNRDTFDLIDTGSRNGTKVNGRTIPKEVPFTLSDGDEIAFADAFYQFRKKEQGFYTEGYKFGASNTK